MVLAAAPDYIRQMIVAKGDAGDTSEVHEVLFELLRDYAPGGIQDKQDVLKSLEQPKIANNVVEALKEMRAWKLRHSRAEGMKLAIPDSQIRMKALQGIVEKAVSMDATLAMRYALRQNEFGLPHCCNENAIWVVFTYLYNELTE